MRHAILIIAVVALAAACGKKDEKDPSTGTDEPSAGAEETPTPAKDENKSGPDFSKWDTAGKEKAWQGSWLVKENGTIQAWSVDGKKVTTWDGEEEETLELALRAPCRAYFKNDQGMAFPRNFTVVDGAVQFRSGGAGYRDGAEAIFCDASSAIYVLDGAGACTIWEEKFGEWESRAGECGIKKSADGAEVFHHADPNGGEFEIQGGAILTRTSFPTERVDGDHAAAKAARDAKAAE